MDHWSLHKFTLPLFSNNLNRNFSKNLFSLVSSARTRSMADSSWMEFKFAKMNFASIAYVWIVLLVLCSNSNGSEQSCPQLSEVDCSVCRKKLNFNFYAKGLFQVKFHSINMIQAKDSHSRRITKITYHKPPRESITHMYISYQTWTQRRKFLRDYLTV